MIDMEKKTYHDSDVDGASGFIGTIAFFLAWGFTNFPLGVGIGLAVYFVLYYVITYALKSENYTNLKG